MTVAGQTFSDHVYATKHGVEIELRVFPAPNAAPDAPWLFWSHGGAFLFCYHQGVVGWVYHNFRERGYHIVSWSYRLAPVASIADMVEDGQDAYAWCVSHLPALVNNNIALDRFVVGGDSAGGCLSTLMGGLLPARAVLDDQGITDLADTWFDTHPDGPTPYSGEFTDDEIEAAASYRDPPYAIIGAACFPDDSPIPSDADVKNEFKSETIRFGRPERLQLDVRRFLGRRSAWVRSVIHPEKYETQDEVKRALREWSALYRLDKMSSYPPTFLIHGAEDDCVPASQSRRMAAKLKEMGVAVGEHYEEGVGHCFNHRFTNDKSAEGFERCVTVPMDFFDKHVRGL